ncbi:1-deoxy-D-xylulose-5-phosphate reductoisomerase [candidate division KSB1 bacterium]|nr:1-deoxy-D-xylulose-5-phosphate reductoisomerase [candidate division KSB1 bacterium]
MNNANQKKELAILGSTGSIGVNCLDVVHHHSDRFAIRALSTHSRVDEMIVQARQTRPEWVAVTGVQPSQTQMCQLEELNCQVFSGADALQTLVEQADYDMLVNAVVGAAGFLPTCRAIERNKDIALANKETLVMGGSIVMNLVAKHHVNLIPIDSEHSAIFQCLMGETPLSIETILLTASGGPFRTWNKTDIWRAKSRDALKHPNWDMGNKITIDSATMMNKGLEVIEACWLFDLAAARVKVVIHPHSIIHSMVQFIDGSIKAQLGVPDMRIPIQLAISYPNRLASNCERYDLIGGPDLTFEEPDLHRFPCLKLAFQAIESGGTAPAVMNAANEIAVQAFLQDRIGFYDISDTIDQCLQSHDLDHDPDEQSLVHADEWARQIADSLIQKQIG